MSERLYRAEISTAEIRDFILAKHQHVPFKTVTVMAKDKLNAMGKLVIMYPKYKIYNLRAA